MQKNTFLHLALIAILTSVSAPVLAGAAAEQNSASEVKQSHVEYRRDLAKKERSLAAAAQAVGKSQLKNKHLALAAHHDAEADAYEKSVAGK
ncbi:hypothetical protein KEF85_08275 [Methylomonas paludis]|uniref:DUF4398 domain-containing protein n=1 Tax=Methylomonas paludis TaxID=1173101 RepID=A0A975RAG1_9GAMM|nr:hypothetical protein [Methylomonas paludis]QWF72425.1 hypothetical protein KEF85_08275 [Methylomonas paludis]